MNGSKYSGVIGVVTLCHTHAPFVWHNVTTSGKTIPANQSGVMSIPSGVIRNSERASQLPLKNHSKNPLGRMPATHQFEVPWFRGIVAIGGQPI